MTSLGNTHKIFAGNLSDWTTRQDIWALFGHYGTVCEADVVKEKKAGKKRNYAFIHMRFEQEANAAIEALNGHVLHGVAMVVRKSGSQKTKIFVGNLHKLTSLEELKKMFEVYGTVAESDILTNFAFIHMDDVNAAKKAIKDLDGFELHGLKLRVQESNTRGRQHGEESRVPVRENTYKIFVGNLSDRVTGQNVRELFEQHGKVVEADVVQEKKRNYGFVHMENEEEGQAAIDALNGHVLLGVAMVVRKSGMQKTKIFVGNLLKDTKLEEVKSLFEQYGSVIESDILTNYAFIHMDDESQAQKAIRELDGYELNGQKIRVQESAKSVKKDAGMGGWNDRAESRFPIRERGGRSYDGRYDPYPPPPPSTYARERMMRFRADLDRYERQSPFYNDGPFERRFGDYPSQPTGRSPLMNKMQKPRPSFRHNPPSLETSYGQKPPPQIYETSYGQKPRPQIHETSYGQKPPPQIYETSYGQKPPPQIFETSFVQKPPPQVFETSYGQKPPPLETSYGQRPPSFENSYGHKPPLFETTQTPRDNLLGLLRFPPPPPPPPQVHGYGPLDHRPY